MTPPARGALDTTRDRGELPGHMTMHPFRHVARVGAIRSDALRHTDDRIGAIRRGAPRVGGVAVAAIRARTALVAVAGVAAALSACDASSRAPAEARLFSAVDSIASPALDGASEPNLAVSPDGELYASWLEAFPDSTHAFRLARRSGQLWDEPVTVVADSALFVNWADFPSVLALGKGRLAAHWLQKSDSGRYAYDVRVAQSADGGRRWGAPLVPHRDGTASEHGFASLWPEPDGRVSLVWLDGRKYARADSGSRETMLMHTTVDGFMRPGEETVLDLRICDCCQTSVAIATDGPVIAYRDRSEDEVRDIHVVRRVGRVWTEPSRVHADEWKVAACPVNGPAIDARGRRVAVAWFTGAGDTARVQLAFSDDGGATFGAPIRVDDGTPAGRVDVVLLDSGAALVSWLEHVAGGAEVRVRRIPEGAERGGAREPAVTIARSAASRAAGFPRMAAVGGDVYFTWTVPGPTGGEPSSVRFARATLAR